MMNVPSPWPARATTSLFGILSGVKDNRLILHTSCMSHFEPVRAQASYDTAQSMLRQIKNGSATAIIQTKGMSGISGYEHTCAWGCGPMRGGSPEARAHTARQQKPASISKRLGARGAVGTDVGAADAACVQRTFWLRVVACLFQLCCESCTQH
eukprot:3508243-Pleurochrysis_carterae.AAC.6